MPAKELGKSSNYWDKRRLLKYTESEKRSKKYINDIRAIYNKANDDIDKMLEDVYRNYSKDTGIDVQTLKSLLTKSETKKTWKELEKQGLDKYIKANYKSRITRLEQIKAQVYAKAKSVYTAEQIKQTELYKSVINDSYYKAIYNMQMGSGLNFAFSRIDNNMMNTLLSNRWSGKNYSKRIWTNTDILADEVSKIVGGSLLSGKGVELTAKQIRERFSVSKYYAERLVRTEMNYYDNQADAMAYEEMGIEEFVPVAVLDNRTSQYCADIDGKHFKYSEMEVGVNYPPFHPNCRCTTRGYLGKKAEKLLTRRARNPITGQNEVIKNMPYNEWLNQYVNNNDLLVLSNGVKIGKNDRYITPIKLDKLPQKHYAGINDVINNAPNDIRKIIENKYDSIKIHNYKSPKNAYYSVITKSISFNAEKDGKDGYKTFFHELSHLLDRRTNNSSQNTIFDNLIREDFKTFENIMRKEYNLSQSKFYDMVSKALRSDSNNNSISDIIGGITSNKCVGRKKHKTEYWEIKGKLGREFYAHIGSAYIRNSEIELENFREVFPNATKYYLEQIRRASKNV